MRRRETMSRADMISAMGETMNHDPVLTRRSWLSGLAFLGLGALGADDSADEKEIRAIARKAGLAKLGTSRSAHYFGIGDAPTAFRETALKLCESLASSYIKKFKEKGFDPEFPETPMTVVILANPKSFEAFKGEPVGETEGGYYEIEANRLVMFDSLSDPKRRGANVARLNTFTLVHEAMHQLTYATGLLNREGDVPIAISEGLATYSENWQLRDPKLGRTNSWRLKALGDPWIPVPKLLTDDSLFTDPATEQRAYAEAWLLIFNLLGVMRKNPVIPDGKLPAYLASIHDRKDDKKRLADAEKAFGDLDVIDAELRRIAKR